MPLYACASRGYYGLGQPSVVERVIVTFIQPVNTKAPRRVRPDYVKEFRCIGSACEDNCCHGWTVSLDKTTYEKYQAIPAMRARSTELFVLTNDPAECNHAQIRHTESGSCQFLSGDGLCNIQKEHGSEYLSSVCATYPRIATKIDGEMEYPPSLSCPEAARLVLLDPRLLPSKWDVTTRRNYSEFLGAPNGEVFLDGNPLRFFWGIRAWSLLLVRDRLYPLWQRLFLLGMFCKRLEALISEGRVGSIPTLLSQYAEIAAQGSLRASLDGIPVRAGVQLEMLMQVVLNYLRHQDPRLSRIRECLQDFLHGIGYVESAPSVESCTRNYVEAYERYYLPFMERHPFLLENYLINHIFRTRFPFRAKPGGEFEPSHHEFLLLCVEFAVIKGLLIGMAGHYREAFGTEHVVKLVQAVAKSIEHSQLFRGALNWQGLADANSIAALLKN